MKKIIITLCFMCISLNFIFAQLTLQKVNSKKTVTISNGTEIYARFPTKTSNPDCDCYIEYFGKLNEASKDSLTVILNSTERLFVDEYGVSRNSIEQIKYPKGKEIETIVRTNNMLSFKRKSENMEALNTFGGVMIFLAVLNQFVISPFYNSEIRGTSDKITWGVFGAGLTFALLPNKKTYHIKQPKSGSKTLWQFKSN